MTLKHVLIVQSKIMFYVYRLIFFINAYILFNENIIIKNKCYGKCTERTATFNVDFLK